MLNYAAFCKSFCIKKYLFLQSANYKNTSGSLKF